MKKLFIAALMATATLTAAAGDIFNSGDNRMDFGARLSVDATVPSDIKYKIPSGSFNYDLYNTGAGFSLGGIMRVPLVYNLYLEPGVTFYYHTVKLDMNAANRFDNVVPEDITGASVREFGLSIPVLLGYHFDFSDLRLHVFTGPEFSLGIVGKTHVSAKMSDMNLGGSESCYDDFRRGDVAWRTGVGVEYLRTYQFSISAAPGLVNWSKTGSMHRTNVSFTLGYNFSL